MNWQPIETAPKDGTVVDLWVNGHRAANCFWRLDEYADPCWHQQYSEMTSASFDISEATPTHWMPLPEPPK